MGPSLELSMGRVKTVVLTTAIFWKVAPMLLLFIIGPESMNNPLVNFSFVVFWFKFCWVLISWYQNLSWDTAGFTLGHQETAWSFWPIHWQREIIKISFHFFHSAILWLITNETVVVLHLSGTCGNINWSRRCRWSSSSVCCLVSCWWWIWGHFYWSIAVRFHVRIRWHFVGLIWIRCRFLLIWWCFWSVAFLTKAHLKNRYA